MFFDGSSRRKPKYVRPHCRLLRALYGHPVAGALWEKTSTAIMKYEGWTSLPYHGGVYVHTKIMAIMIVYVDDILFLASYRDTIRIWRTLERRINYKDPESDIERYLGARYRFDDVDAKKPCALRTLLTDMDAYVCNAVTKSQAEFGGKLTKVASPYLSNDETSKEGTLGVVFSSSCASHVATLLFLARVARPDVSVAVQRLCRVVTKCTTTHDLMLIRLYSYLHSTGPISLVAELGQDDLQHEQLCIWSDADLCGDPEDTKSTSGICLELVNPTAAARWPISLSVKRQGATACFDSGSGDSRSLHCHQARRNPDVYAS